MIIDPEQADKSTLTACHRIMFVLMVALQAGDGFLLFLIFRKSLASVKQHPESTARTLHQVRVKLNRSVTVKLRVEL